jgi:hypothetical protein
MFVTNHVLSGVVVGRLLERHPVAAFVVGVGSHLALDFSRQHATPVDSQHLARRTWSTRKADDFDILR